MPKADQVVALARELRGGDVPESFAEACEVVAHLYPNEALLSAELEHVQATFDEVPSDPADAAFYGWAGNTVHAIRSIALYLAAPREEIPPWATDSATALVDAEPGWVDRLRVILESGSWESRTMH